MTPKYILEQAVWMMKDNLPTQYYVMEVEERRCTTTTGGVFHEVYYVLVEGWLGNPHSWGHRVVKKEHAVYSTKHALINSLYGDYK